MPRYFFHVFDDTEFIKDASGIELPDLKAARAELERVVAKVPEKLRHPGARVALHDEAGNMLDESWVTPTT